MMRTATSHFRMAWRAFKAHASVLVICTLVLFASWVCLELAVVATYRWSVVWNIGLHGAFLVVFSGLLLGMHRMALEAADGRAPDMHGLTALLARGPSFLLAFCIYLVAVAGGLVLLVVPGIYIAVRYAFFGYVLASKPASALEALRDAATLSRGRWWEVCRFLLLVLTSNLAGAALLGVGLLISFPVSLLAGASYFRILEMKR